VTRTVADAYTDTGGAWAAGPEVVYGRLATVMVEHTPAPLRGRRVVDVGAGTGAATRAAIAVGASAVVAVDVSVGMLRHDAANRAPALVADGLALPIATDALGGALAAFSLTHLGRPGDGLREMARVSRRGSPLLAASYAADDTHPVKDAVEAALGAQGWRPPPWYVEMRRDLAPQLATEDRCLRALADAGLDDGTVTAVRVAFPELRAGELVRWRLGMAQHAPFFRALTAGARRSVLEDAEARLGDPPEPLVRSVLVIAAISR
jgi:SAM-dependent methyltransferase